MPDVTLDLADIANGKPNDANPIRTAFTALQNGINNLDGDNFSDAIADEIGANSSSKVRRGKSIVPTSDTRTGTSYGLMATADRVQDVVMPTDGLIAIAYRATWEESVVEAARAAIFVGSNQIKVATNNGAPVTQAALIRPDGGSNLDVPLSAYPGGLVSAGGSGSGAGSPVTTGQVVGLIGNAPHIEVGSGEVTEPGFINGGVCLIDAAAGTYDVSVQFKASSGSVSVRDRKLWVWTIGF